MDFYNDNDAVAAAWLRELIAAGHLPEGTVDERPIQEITGADLAGHRQVHFFAGIGGWPYALQLAGWPATRPVWTGSCPCQPFSAAGKRKGQADERHLWPVFLRLIRECQPATVFGEQVASDDGYRWLARVRDDLEEAGYAVGCADLPACCAGAPHIRQRLFWVANAKRPERRPHEQHEQLSTGRQQATGGPRSGRNARRLADAAGIVGSGGIGEQERGPDRRAANRWAGAGTERLEHHASDGRGERGAESDGRGVAGGCGVGGVGDTSSTGPQERIGNGRVQPGSSGADARQAAKLGSPWDASRIIYCRDDKYRRVPVEPALFPLAPRVPGRVGMLRGAGNSIVPQVAAKFIRAFLECEQ